MNAAHPVARKGKRIAPGEYVIDLVRSDQRGKPVPQRELSARGEVADGLGDHPELDALVLDSAYPTYGESAWYQTLRAVVS